MNIVSLRKNIIRTITPNILRGTQNKLSESNTGFRAIVYGKKEDDYSKPGIIHWITAGRFYKELIQYMNLTDEVSKSAAIQRSGIYRSIPEGYKNAFTENLNMEEIIESPITDRLVAYFSNIRKGYDMVIDKPIARVRSTVYFAKEGIKDFFKYRLKKDKEINMDFAKRCFPSYQAIPKDIPSENLKKFLVELLRKNYTPKEVKQILKGQPPTFYRFVDETELRAIKNGYSMRSSAGYNVEDFLTDITSDPKYNFNKYRITFKRNNKGWNPYEKNSFVRVHDNTVKSWWLCEIEYDKSNIVCTERVK